MGGMRCERHPTSADTGTTRLLRVGFAAVTAAAVLVGTLTWGEAVAPELVGVLLLPTAVYVVGVRSRRLTLVCGAFLAGVTAAAWIMDGLHKKSSMAGADIGMAAFSSFICACACTAADLAERRAATPPGTSSRSRR